MELTEENKKTIDAKSYEELLEHWRFAPIGDPWFEGQTGEYWGERMKELRNQPNGQYLHVTTSKKLGWEK